MDRDLEDTPFCGVEIGKPLVVVGERHPASALGILDVSRLELIEAAQVQTRSFAGSTDERHHATVVRDRGVRDALEPTREGAFENDMTGSHFYP